MARLWYGGNRQQSRSPTWLFQQCLERKKIAEVKKAKPPQPRLPVRGSPTAREQHPIMLPLQVGHTLSIARAAVRLRKIFMNLACD